MSNNEIDKMLQTIMANSGANEVDLDEFEGKSIRQLFDLQLEQLGLTQFQVESLLAMERKTVNGILDKTAKRVDVVNMLKLGNFLGIPFEKLMALYQIEMPAETIGDLERSKKASYIINNFDISHLKKGHVFKGKESIQNIEKRILDLFGFDNIYQYETYGSGVAFSRTKKQTPSYLMRDFWVKSAYAHFGALGNPNDYNRDLLVDLIPKIRPYSMNVENGLITIARALYNVGVTLIFQPKLPNVQARGATMIVKNKPCIVITDLNKNYPTLWFALMHEIFHVLYDLDQIKDKWTYHITGGIETDFMLTEPQADNFARDYLFSHEKSNYIRPLINNEIAVKEFARSSQVHESFVYNYYNYDRNEAGDKYAWTRFKDKFPKVELATKDFNSHLWEDGKTILESVKFLEEKVFKIK